MGILKIATWSEVNGNDPRPTAIRRVLAFYSDNPIYKNKHEKPEVFYLILHYGLRLDN